MSLGSYPEVTLQDARLKHQAREKILHDGRNPMEVRKEGKRASTAFLDANSAVKSFAEIEKEWFEHWKPEKDRDHGRQLESRIETDIHSRSGNKPIDEIEAPDIVVIHPHPPLIGAARPGGDDRQVNVRVRHLTH
jgi:hypothetical protein